MMRQLGLLLFILFATPFAFAGSISKISGTGAIVTLDGEPASVGDTYFAMDGGKKKALVKVVKIKGDKALVKIVKGNAAVGMTLQKSGAGGGSSGGGKVAKRKKSGDSGASMAEGRMYWGGMVGLAMDSMSVQVNDYYTNANRGTVALSGMGFSAKGLFDYGLLDQVWFRGTGGIEQFKGSGSSNCGVGNTSSCDVNIMYLSLDFTARYLFMTGNIRPWAGLGLSLLFPASKSTTALASSSVGSTSTYGIAGGVDWFISPTMYIPISVEYMMLPKSDEVDAHWIAIRAGVAVPF